ncbi:MAG: VIT family protein [Candidatus Melainabacteria bacterium]|nr:VIT family protein [Candidatus Melainabacteria bacterium]
MAERHGEKHSLASVGWLRAAVLGANDGIVSTSSLILGVAAAHSAHNNILITGVAGLVAGAMSMATGEYVSVHSQVDTEKSALDQERTELLTDYASEVNELKGIYVARGIEPALARQVAEQLMAHDALDAHARDELGISEAFKARPLQAALASAGSFAAGALLPLLVVVIVPHGYLIPSVSVASLLFLALLGAVAAKIGKANVLTGLTRVTFWSAMAMAVTAGIGALVGTAL